MITKKIIVTGLIVNNLQVIKDCTAVHYWIGNDIERTLVIDKSISLSKNILKYENLLVLENIDDTDKEIYWYNGLTNIVCCRDDDYFTRAWFQRID